MISKPQRLKTLLLDSVWVPEKHKSNCSGFDIRGEDYNVTKKKTLLVVQIINQAARLTPVNVVT